ncbi:MAG: metallophosphoesterase, partial [Oscillospiraceae bacterium]
MKMKKIISSVLSATIVTTCLATINFANVSATTTFDENNIVSRFGVLSDVHQTGEANGRDEQRLRTAIKRLYKESDNKLDGISISGDLTDYKIKEGLQQFKKVMDEELKGDTKLTFTLGNHDIDAIKFDGKNLANEILGDKYYSYDEPDSMVSYGNRHTVMGNYHFLSVYTNDFWNENGPSFRTETKTWLDNQLKKITQENPNQYVFVSAHMFIQ